jgi:hypothetical protein
MALTARAERLLFASDADTPVVALAGGTEAAGDLYVHRLVHTSCTLTMLHTTSTHSQYSLDCIVVEVSVHLQH